MQMQKIVVRNLVKKTFVGTNTNFSINNPENLKRTEKSLRFVISNPPGYEVCQVNQDGWENSKIRARYFDCPETLNNMAEVVTPENIDQTLIRVTFNHITCLGMMHSDIYPIIQKTFLIKDNHLEELKEL